MRSLSWHSFLRIAALVFLAIALVAWSVTIIGWLTTDNPKFEPLNVLVSAVIPSVLSLLTYLSSRNASTEPITLPRSDNRLLNRRNRQRMLETVRLNWVKGVLEDSLQNAVWIELGKEEKREAVEQPLDMVLKKPERPNRTLPKGTKIIQVFDDLNGNMLILGEPGSGKTTTLLELARDLIDRAEKDDTLPMPVIFNLSSWATERKPLADWLADELNTKYQVPKKVAQEWVKTDALALLLDGLDEVAQQHRNTCVEAINAYRDGRASIVDIVVCSRTNEYDDLTTKLKMQGAIVLKPLTSEQIEDYLEAFGEKTLILRRLLQGTERKTQLMEIAKSPLMLSIMIVAYQQENMPPDAAILGRSFTLGQSRLYDSYKLLFDAYVKRMFERRGRDPRYRPEQTVKWLSWLAEKMVRFEQATFYIEGLQPSWLNNTLVIHIYIAFTTYFGILSAQLINRLTGGSVASEIVFVLGGFAANLRVKEQGEKGLIEVGGIKVIETMSWSWHTFRYQFPIVIVAGPVAGLALSVLGWGSNLLTNLAFGVSFSITIMGMAIFTDILKSGSQLQTKTKPNQGIWLSIKNSLAVGLIVGLGYGLLQVPLKGVKGIIDGFAIGFWFSFLFLGGFASLKHFLIRLILARAGYTPWNYARFLDFCAERIFLRKVGGGYIFVHRLLMEYFAGLDEDNCES